MKLNFAPKSEMTNDEIKVIKSFLEELTSECNRVKCDACLFNNYCDNHPDSPSHTIIEILDTLGIDLK